MRIVMEDAMVQLLFTLEDLVMKVAVLEAKIERLECNAAELQAFSPAGLPADASRRPADADRTSFNATSDAECPSPTSLSIGGDR